HVEWQQVAEEREDGRRPRNFKLVNGTSGVAAEVITVEDISDGLRDAVRNDLRLPETVNPGGSIPLHIDRSLASGYPTVVRVTWREGKPHGRFRKRTYTNTFYFQ